jgi:hypothetical protein
VTVFLREDAADFLVKSRRIELPTGARIAAMRRVLEGRGDEPFEKADALSPDEPTPDPRREAACPTCGGFFKNPGALARHRIARGHVPRTRTENAEVTRGDDLETSLTKAATKEEQRYTLSPLYPASTIDHHGEWASPADLQKALWDYVQKGDRKLRRQHGREVIGEVLEIFQRPDEHLAELHQADGSVVKKMLPAGTVYCGCRWTPEAFEEVKNGRINGLSMGGKTLRVRGVSPS